MQPRRWEKGCGMALRFLVSQIFLESQKRRGQLSKDERDTAGSVGRVF